MASNKGTSRKRELDHELRIKRLDVLSNALDKFFPSITILGVTIFGIYLPAQALAGKTTLANIGIAVFGDVTISQAVSYLFGLSGIAYGLRAQRLRRSVTVRLAERERALELKIDSERTSSGLTPRGETPRVN
jgi:hypothetical protein